METMRQAMQNLDIYDTLRAQPDEVLDWLANHSVLLTGVAARAVNAEVSRRLREMRP